MIAITPQSPPVGVLFFSEGDLTDALGTFAKSSGEVGPLDVWKKVGNVSVKKVPGIQYPFAVGQIVRTRNGKKARILATDVNGRDSMFPVLAGVAGPDSEEVNRYTLSGRYYSFGATNQLDLIPNRSECFDADFTPVE